MDKIYRFKVGSMFVSVLLILNQIVFNISPALAGTHSPVLLFMVKEELPGENRYLPTPPIADAESPVGFRPAAQGAAFTVNFNPTAGCKTSAPGLSGFMPAGTLVAWPQEAKDAFNHAVRIWAMLLDTNQTIVINACWLDPDPASAIDLGIAQPVSVPANFLNVPETDTLYPVALANELAEADLNNGDGSDHDGINGDTDAEIIIAFNKNRSWYFGTDGNPPGNKYDFVTTALHEIGHGLGFVSTLFANTSTEEPCDSVDPATTEGDGCWGLGLDQPIIYDRFVENDSSQKLIDTNLFANPSAALGGELTGNVFFNGPKANEANNNAQSKLYAPNSFEISSSILHLDENTYDNTSNQLMTPIIDKGIPQHHPGSITLGIFKDMGWSIVDLPPATMTKSASVDSVAAGQLLTYTLSVTNTGLLVMTDVTITDTVPPHTILNADSLSDDAATSGTVITWTTGVSLTTGNILSRTFAVTVSSTVADVLTITNTAFVTSTAGVGVSAAQSTTVLDTTPPTFSGSPLVTPTSGVIITTNRPSFDWEDAVDNREIVSYTLTITNDGSTLSLQAVDSITTTESSYIPGSDLPEGNYSWTVRAYDAAGNVTDPVTPATFAIQLNPNSASSRVYLPIVLKE